MSHHHHNTMLYIMDPYCLTSYTNIDTLWNLQQKFWAELEIDIMPSGVFAWSDNDLSKLYKISSPEKFPVSLWKAFLENKNWTIDSNLASKAINVVRDLSPDNLIQFVIRLQKKWFIDGQKIESLEVFTDICKQLSIDIWQFTEVFTSVDAQEFTNAIYNTVKQNKLPTPSFLLMHWDHGHMIAQWTADMMELTQVLENWIHH